MNDKGACRTAPSTPGLLIIFLKDALTVLAWTLSLFSGHFSTLQLLQANLVQSTFSYLTGKVFAFSFLIQPFSEVHLPV